MANMRFFRHYGRNAMESWFDRAQTVWVAAIPPPPPAGRPGFPSSSAASSAEAPASSSSSGGPATPTPPLPPAGRRGRSRTPTPATPAAAAKAEHGGQPGPVTRKALAELVAKAAKAARIELPGVIAQKAPPVPKTAYTAVPQPPPLQKAMPKAPKSNVWPKVVSKVPPIASPLQMQARQDVLDDRLRFVALCGLSVLDVRDDFKLTNPTSRDGRPMDLNSQGADYDWFDRYLWCVAVTSRRPLLSAIESINFLPDPNTHSGIISVDSEDVILYIRGRESWSYETTGGRAGTELTQR